MRGAEAKTQKSGTKESKRGEDSDLVKKWQRMPGKEASIKIQQTQDLQLLGFLGNYLKKGPRD